MTMLEILKAHRAIILEGLAVVDEMIKEEEELLQLRKDAAEKTITVRQADDEE